MSDVPESYLEDDSFTISYGKEGWTCFHDYIGDFRFSTRNENLYSFNDNKLYIHNQESIHFYNDNVIESYITPVFVSEDFLLNHIEIDVDIYSNNKRLLEKTVDFISFHNSYQSTDKIQLVLIDNNKPLKQQWAGVNIRRLDNKWNFNKIYDKKLVGAIPIIEKFDEELSGFIIPRESKQSKPFVDTFVIAKITYVHRTTMTMVFNEVNINVTRL